jgi:iron complex transport system ATP-binding protein
MVTLQTSNLGVGYSSGKGTLELFRNLNLQLTKGQLVCFMGPNGAGKSTLIRTLAGLQSPLYGSISSTDEKNIAVVLTDKISSSHMTVLELITYGRYPYLNWSVSLRDEDHAVIDVAVSTVHIEGLLDKKLYELSDGQMQLVMVARALTQQTPILLLDEPTAHLDLNNRVEIMNLLRRLARVEGKTILIATHELDLALQTADLIWLTIPGKSIKTGIPEDLVLDGSIDSVFQFKGFDLKSGKMEHQPYRGVKIKLEGEGSTYLWTKNALERKGFEVTSTEGTEIKINSSQWSAAGKSFPTIHELLRELDTL